MHVQASRCSLLYIAKYKHIMTASHDVQGIVLLREAASNEVAYLMLRDMDQKDKQE